MTRAQRALTLAASALALLGLAGPASAATESFTFSVAPQAAPYSASFSLPSFDPTMGTLTGVAITSMEVGTATVTVINNTGSSQNFTNATASYPFTLTGPAGTNVALTATASVASGSVAANSTGSYPGAALNASSSTNLPAASFAAFTAPGATPLGFNASVGTGSYAGTGLSGVFFGGSGLVGGSVTVTYTFTAAVVPEPASLGLVALGLGAIAAAGRPRRRAA